MLGMGGGTLHSAPCWAWDCANTAAGSVFGTHKWTPRLVPDRSVARLEFGLSGSISCSTLRKV